MTQHDNPQDGVENDKILDLVNQPIGEQPPEMIESANITQLNRRWQLIREWEMRRMKIEALNHALAFRQQVEVVKLAEHVATAANDQHF